MAQILSHSYSWEDNKLVTIDFLGVIVEVSQSNYDMLLDMTCEWISYLHESPRILTKDQAWLLQSAGTPGSSEGNTKGEPLTSTVS